MENTVLKESELKDRLDFAVRAARLAGGLTLDHFRCDDLTVEHKADDSPVTVADRHAEQSLRKQIDEEFPDDAILGEEFDDKHGTSGFRWILDPIDGTQSFVHGVPLYSTLVAVEHGGESILGVICLPALDQCVYAASGMGAWQVSGNGDPKPARVSKHTSLGEGLFLTSEVDGFSEIGRHDTYLRLQSAARVCRTWGDGYGYAMVATGRADLMVDPIMAVWDAGPLLPIMEEAGGTFTDWIGRPTIHSGQGIATNGLILPEVLSLIGGE
ncbi:MAG: histidinol-phosphatase [Pirellulales bacterium]|nr:histidinol-phosphatase [Pirellulales bacterium]